MAKMVNRVYVEIDGTEYDCSDIDENLDVGGSPVPVFNRRDRSIGHSYSVPTFQFSLTIPVRADQGVDFFEMALRHDEFTVTVEYDAWKTRKYLDTTIQKANIASKVGDSTTVKLDCDALDIG